MPPADKEMHSSVVDHRADIASNRGDNRPRRGSQTGGGLWRFPPVCQASFGKGAKARSSPRRLGDFRAAPAGSRRCGTEFGPIIGFREVLSLLLKVAPL